MITVNMGNVWSKLTYDDAGASPLKNNLDHSFRPEVPGAKYVYAFKSGQWDGKAKLWDVTAGGNIMIRTGLVPRLLNLLTLGGIPWVPGTDHRNLPVIQLINTQVPLRKYQYRAVLAAFGNADEAFGWQPRGVLEVATGGGKTEIAVAMYEMNPVPTFFLVHRKDLLIQAKERFEKYGHTVGVIGAGKFEPQDGINIATLQTLKSIMGEEGVTTRKNVMAMLMGQCQQVFFDECHLMASSIEKGNEFVELADMFDVPFRWGLTATPFMRTQYDNLLLEGVTGQSLYRITSSQLVTMGYLTPPKVILKKVPGVTAVSMNWKAARSNKNKASHWREVEMKGIKFNEIRTRIILDEIAAGPFPVLVLVKTVEQAQFIQKLSSTNIPFLSGKDSAKDRRAAVASLQDGSLKALLTTTIFDEGVDIPELRKVILASGGKSAVKTIQRVGRALRTADGKTEAIIIDFQDEHHYMLKKHAQVRRKIYEEQEFEVICEKV